MCPKSEKRYLKEVPSDVCALKVRRGTSGGTFWCMWGWSGGAKVLCILHHWGVQLILAYSWARPAILVVGKGRGGMFLFLLFLHFHSCSSFFPVPLFHLLYSLFYLFFSLSLGDDTKWPSRVDVSLNPNTINQFWCMCPKSEKRYLQEVPSDVCALKVRRGTFRRYFLMYVP